MLIKISKILYVVVIIVYNSTTYAASESGSQVAWSLPTLKIVRNGDPERGKNLAESCKSCHGQRGEGVNTEVVDDESTPAIPALAGQNPFFLFKQLHDYANGDRDNPTMAAIAKNLTDENKADLAAWFSSLELPHHPKSNKDLKAAEIIATKGDGKRVLPPCSVCHGNYGQGDKIDIPSLGGQRSDYLERTLMAYRSGARHNDIYSRMRLIAKQLSVEEIKNLSIYYQEFK
jgi:cytochrome c553